jgi:demethylspheroidene O-methyltransferase
MTASKGERRILDLLDGFLRSKVLMTCYRLDVFTRAKGGVPRATLLEQLRLPARSGAILLDAAIALGLLEEDGDQVRTPLDLAEWLCRGENKPFQPTSYLIEYYEDLYPHLAAMDELVRSDGASSTFRLRDYFKDDVTEVDPDVAARYSAYMDATIARIVGAVHATYDFSKHRYLFDLCGGTGAFLTGILRRQPGLRGGFVDVPACVEIGRRRLLEEPALGARVDAIAGDVFKTPVPPEADVVTMCRAAMDWGDERIGGLYRTVRDALPPGGRFLVIERMVPEGKITPESESLHLRAVYFLAKSTTTRYRTRSEHRALLLDAGFAQVECLNPPEAPYEQFQNMSILAATRT